MGIDFGLGGLFKGIEKLIDLAAEVEKESGEIKKEGKIDLGCIRQNDKSRKMEERSRGERNLK